MALKQSAYIITDLALNYGAAHGSDAAVDQPVVRFLQPQRFSANGHFREHCFQKCGACITDMGLPYVCVLVVWVNENYDRHSG